MKSFVLACLLCFATVDLFSQPKDSSTKNEKPAAQSTPTPASSNNDHKSANHTETTKSGPPHWYTSSEWWLVIIAGLTGFAIAYQAREMTKTTKIIGKQAALMKTQTDILVEYNKATRENADAAIDNAKATKASVDLLVNKERMRISIEVLPLELEFGEKVLGHPRHLGHSVEYRIIFYGSTVAFVEVANATAEITDSPEPPTRKPFGGTYLPRMIIPGIPPHAGSTMLGNLTQFQIDSINHKKSFVHFRGCIRYKDFMEKDIRETCFCYTWNPRSPDHMAISWAEWRKSGPPEANRET